MDIEEINRRARAEGLSYGQYVAKHKVELAGKRPKPKALEGVSLCKHCRKAFEPTNPRHVFCSNSCRSAWNQKQKRKSKMREAQTE